MGTRIFCEEAAAVLGGQVKKIALDGIFSAAGTIPVAELQYSQEVRAACEKNVCRGYGATWACPPSVGTVAACRQRVEQYDTMLLFSRCYPLEDSFDFEGMMAALVDFKKRVDVFAENLPPQLSDYLLLSNEGCHRCEKCTYPAAPCRFPEKLYHALEGYGFLVSGLASQAGIPYHNGANTVTYFGTLLFRDTDE